MIPDLAPATAIALGVLAHLLGDYILQSHWMAVRKTSKWFPAIVHGIAYGIPFIAVTLSPVALVIIVGTHIVIDHYRLARHLIWVKNLIAPRAYRAPWRVCTTTGFAPSVPAGLATALLIVVDNTMHIAINTTAILCL